MTEWVEIDLIPSTAQTLTVTLGQFVYTMDLAWNAVSQCWILDILDGAGAEAILRGIPLVPGVDLLGQYEYTGIGGKLAVLSVALGRGFDVVPGFDDFGNDSHLFFGFEPEPVPI